VRETITSGTRITGAQAIAEMADGYGVTSAFFVPTFAISALAEMNRRGIQTISTHGEKAAAYMADGYARATGRTGVCMAQTVGGALLAAGLKDAFMVSVPIVAMTGGPVPESRGRQVYQQVDDYQMFTPVTKWQGRAEQVSRLPELLRQAFRAATAGAPGPVHLELAGHLGQLVDEEDELQPFVEPQFGATPPFRPLPGDDLLAAAARELAAAERPVIVAGQGIMSSGAEGELLDLAEQLDIPVATSLNAKAAMPDSHPLALGVVGLYSRRCANQAVARADLVFFAGTRANSMTTANWQVPEQGKSVIQLDISPEELGRHYPTRISLHGDARASLRRLVELAEPRKNEPWIDDVQDLVSAWRREVEPMRRSDAVPIRPERICAEIGELLPADGAVVVDTLQASIWAGSMMYLKGPSQRFVRCGGSLGWALPASIGAKAGLGKRAVMCFTGDGGIYYHLAELETAARYGLNVIVVVNNNGAYAGEEEYWIPAYRGAPSESHWQFGDRNFARIASELGCEGIRVDRPDALGEALRRALSSDRPVLIDVVSDFSAYHPKGWTPAAPAE
jgi:acetolactate synthase-1/2/3 large subunit